jgi:ABC-2 type transport system permease protein
MGVILTMTMVLMTGLAITRERERGTMENLLSTPATALEVMTGKIVPYVMIGLIQVTLVLILAKLIFNVPMQGNLGVLYLAVLLFIAAT